jgi:tRNA pseudouridine32 synthase / 23S rRNA pseudouridine746 synthase
LRRVAPAPRYPEATGPLVVHRLDLDTSGLLLVAKELEVAKALQRLFSLREIHKHYVAWLDGTVAGERGRIATCRCASTCGRSPSQHSRSGARQAGRNGVGGAVARHARTLVAFTPHTGRTHQLRVHAAHPLGLDAPIVGDRLYGRTPPLEGERLLLHAERLEFVHPVTGAAVRLLEPAPF